MKTPHPQSICTLTARMQPKQEVSTLNPWSQSLLHAIAPILLPNTPGAPCSPGSTEEMGEQIPTLPQEPIGVAGVDVVPQGDGEGQGSRGGAASPPMRAL